MAHNYFSGSYPANDVRFLLKPIHVENTSVSIKEALIQCGQKHYSEMLTYEKAPSEAYLSLFHQALTENQSLMARDTLRLAEKIVASRPDGITLVSLARAGTPVGVLLKRVLQKHFSLDAAHYSISIIRDIGIDENALLQILKHYHPESIVFVDGWTGKGVISRQLEISLNDFAKKHQVEIRPELYVLADLSGTAFVSASTEDYLIPSSILNATVSGLISRSIIDRKQLSDTDYHGCFFYQEYADVDLSSQFVDIMMASIDSMAGNELSLTSNQAMSDDVERKTVLRQQSGQFLDWVRQFYRITNPNLIKPGIGESTRALLRREADLLLVKSLADPSIKHLIYLAESKKIQIQLNPNIPYRAAVLINEHR